MTMMKRIIFRITGMVRLIRKTCMTKTIGETGITRVMRQLRRLG